MRALFLAVLAVFLVRPVTAEPAHPFVYLGHGNGVQEGWHTVWIWFQHDVPQEKLAALVPTAPLPLSVTAAREVEFFLAIGPRALRVNSDDFFQDYVRLTYNEKFRKRLGTLPSDATKRYWKMQELAQKLFEDGDDNRYPTDAEWAAYHREVDAWLQAVHARHPIAFALKTGNKQGEAPTAWHTWSVAQAPAQVLPRLSALFRAERDAQSKMSPEAFDATFTRRVQELLRYVLVWVVPPDAGALDATTRQAVVDAVEPALGYPGRAEMDASLRKYLDHIRPATPAR